MTLMKYYLAEMLIMELYIYLKMKNRSKILCRRFYNVKMSRKIIIKDSFNNLMLNGATLVLNRIDTKSTKTNKLTKSISYCINFL